MRKTKEFKFAKVVKAVAEQMAKNNYYSASLWCFYQPKEMKMPSNKRR